jgi:hypothetical protein
MDTNVRVVALGSNPYLRTVSIVTSLAGLNANEVTACTQLTAAQAAASPNIYETVMAGPTGGAGLRTVYIAGYTGPN